MPGPNSVASVSPRGVHCALEVIHGQFYAATLTGALTLDASYPTHLKLDPGGAHRDITLDAESAINEGMRRHIVNAADAAENLVVKDADANTIGTINQNEEGIFFVDNDGAWQLFRIATIALS